MNLSPVALSAFIYAIALLRDGKISSLRDGATESDRGCPLPAYQKASSSRLNKQFSFI